jgi:hypothetical protein
MRADDVGVYTDGHPPEQFTDGGFEGQRQMAALASPLLITRWSAPDIGFGKTVQYQPIRSGRQPNPPSTANCGDPE